MKKYLGKFLMLVIGVMGLVEKGEGQNLVPNGSFEEYYDCPTLGGFNNDQVAECIGWWSFGNTSDYFNTCAVSPDVLVPYNLFGHQFPKTGNAYCGFFTRWLATEHEFVGCRLIEPLEIGQQYYVEFNVCSASKENGYAGVFTNNLGARFSMDSFSTNHPVPINNVAHINSTSVITDSINWIKISGYYTADSAYEFVAFGNFFTNAMTDTIQFYSGASGAYYYIDDVYVSEDTATGIKDQQTNLRIALTPNAFTTQLQIHYTITQPGELMVYDALGRKVKSYALAASQNTFELSVAELPAGVYLVAVNSGGRVWSDKVVKSALR